MIRTSLLVAMAGLSVAGCAAQTESMEPAPVAASAPAPDPAGAARIAPAPGGYKLTQAEMALDCPKLTGQMRVRIANMRANYSQPSGTVVSRTMQSALTPIYGGTNRGADPQGDLQLDRAKLEAFNRRLAEKKCKTLDIDAELRGEPSQTAASPARK